MIGILPDATGAIVAAVAVPAIGAVAIACLRDRPNLREAATLVTAMLLFAVVVSLVPEVMAGERPDVSFGHLVGGVALAFRVEPLGLLFACVASFLWIANSVYSFGYMRANAEKHQTRFYILFAVALLATVGVAFAANLLTLFLFYELLTLSTYPLVTHAGTPEALRAGRVYLGMLIGTSVGLLLLAIVWTWVLAGTLDFRGGGILAGKASGPAMAGLLALYAFGIGKAALMPVHRWLPAAMVAPVPVSALLHAVAVVKAGVFTVVKVVVYIFGVPSLADVGPSAWLIYVAGGTVLLASISALRQDNLKRRLAYSTVSQLAYVVLAAAVLTPISVLGAALHIAAHAFGKITLFFAAGSIYTAGHKTEVSQLAGIGRRMPWTMGAFAVASLSMVGVPPTAGFVSKWYMLVGAWQAHQRVALAVMVTSTLLTAAYLLPIVYAAFLRHEGPGEPHGEAPAPLVVALVATAVGTVAMFFLADYPLRLAAGLLPAMQP